MIAMEGPLSKWTNLVKGWQYRWFVIDEHEGILAYYTSKEKRLREVRRGAVNLRGAVIGIDDEDDSTFTITVDKKTFHFQARDADEKERWISVLETTIRRLGYPRKELGAEDRKLCVSRFDSKLVEADAYLKLLIEQIKGLELRIADCSDNIVVDKCLSLKNSAETMIESVKQSIVLLQIAKHQLFTSNEDENVPVKNFGSAPSSAILPRKNTESLMPQPAPPLSSPGGVSSSSSVHRSAECLVKASNLDTKQDMPTGITSSVSVSQSLSSSLPNLTTPTEEFSDGGDGVPALITPLRITARALSTDVASDSSSDDEGDFYDAEEGREQSIASLDTECRASPKVILSNDDYFDELYDCDDEGGLESMESHGSMITHLLSQLRIGMDLTKVTLPTFILEKRSLLEMYSDFFAHPDLFVGIVDQKTPRDRLVQVVRWYLSAFHAGRKSAVPKKPYNPILGETFRCFYDLPGASDQNQELSSDGPIPWCKKSNLAYIAEQVSHHPPISAFYVECFSKRISLDGYIWTKSKFLGLSIGVHMIGQAVLSVLDHDEDYIITFPNAYGRSILTVPWMEMGGIVTISCPKTGYSAQIEFHTKPFYGGKKDQITAEMYSPNDKKSFCTVKGEWNGVMAAKYAQSLTQTEIFVDTKNMPIIKKQVRPIEKQTEFESRRLWRDVTMYLKQRDVDGASDSKRKLEQRQRDEAEQRRVSATKYETNFFHEVGEHWVYDKPLVKRLTGSQITEGATSGPLDDLECQLTTN